MILLLCISRVLKESNISHDALVKMAYFYYVIQIHHSIQMAHVILISKDGTTKPVYRKTVENPAYKKCGQMILPKLP